VFWKTGHVDFLTVTMEAGTLLKTLAAGWAAIILAAIVIGWRRRQI
jgi:hypothetical protein